MSKLIRPRRLWFESKGEIISLDESALVERPEPLVILGEAGMGKTELAGRLEEEHGYGLCTARQLMRRGVQPLLDDATTLVIDALDEVGTKGEGDAVDLVLGKLADANFPRFVLTCRVADWRNATALSALRTDYPEREPLVLHLDPLNEEDIIAILADRLRAQSSAPCARTVFEHFKTRNLDGLLGNPQTLELIARAVDNGPLPGTKLALFGKAVEVLRREHRDEKIALQPDEATALNAAGAAFASLILTGADVVVREVADPGEGELPWAEVAALPGGAGLDRVLGSRLFGGKSAERFTYWHRSIGEYLGARWLAARVDSALGRQRLLQLFQADALVPASLRGLHAWLAHQGDRELALAVIARDPMGVIEYGDGDALGLEESRALLVALKELAQRDPLFREWKRYSIKGLMQALLLPEVRALIVDPHTEYGLRALLLEALKGSPLADPLRMDLQRLVFDHGEALAHRLRATDALVALGGEDWQAMTQRLLDEGSDDSVGLALEVAAAVDGLPITDALLIAIVIRHAELDTSSLRRFRGLQKALPDARIEGFLDAFVAGLPTLGNRHERANNDELTDLGYDLIVRRLEFGEVDPLRLWRWLRPFDEARGFSRDARRAVHERIRADDELRRAIQRHVLLDEPGDKTLWERAWRLTSRSPGFQLTDVDVLLLFDRLSERDREGNRWKDLVRLVRHSEAEGKAVRERAKTFVSNRPDMLAWIDQLAERHLSQWEIKQAQENRHRKAKIAMEWQEHRKSFEPHTEEMRAGEFQWLVQPARAYLDHFHDLGEGKPAHRRVAHWLGEELAQAANDGFDAFLLSGEPPAAQQVAESVAERRTWHATHIIIAALAERWRRLGASGFADVSDDRLLTAFHELRHSQVADHAGLAGLGEAVESEIRVRELVERATRQSIEPQLAMQRDHVEQLYGLMRDVQLRSLGAQLAEEWLERFPDMAQEPEAELLDRLLQDGRFDLLRRLEAERHEQGLSTERRANWNGVAFVVDFEGQRERLNEIAKADHKWFWTLRNRLGSDRWRNISVRLTPAQLAWIVATFRGLFPHAEHPSGVYGGDANSWDATDFLFATANRLADDTSQEAVRQLAALLEAPADGYTNGLRARAAEQARKAVQERYRPVALVDLRAIVECKPPTSVADLQATVLALLEAAQARIRSSPDDVWRHFYDDRSQPRNEEWCRDVLLTILGLRPEGIEFSPEGHLADDRRVDISAARFGIRLPIEIKGQWHSDLWRAAGNQLERFYTGDHAAGGRGIYLVLWFGHSVDQSKKPRARALGQRRPETLEALRDNLIKGSDATRDGRIKVVVLDLSRPRA